MTVLDFQGFKYYPGDRDIWRYMDLSSLLWILENEKLHFNSPVDDFEDPYETTLPKAWYEFREDQMRGIGEAFDHDPDEFWEQQGDQREEMRNNIYATCWHANQRESAAMWELYGASNQTVAIRTTINKLREAFQSQDEYAVAVGDVKYVDFDSGMDDISADDMDKIRSVHSGNADSVGLTLLKRKEFIHEKEVRGVVLDGVISDWMERHPSGYSPNQDVSPPVNVSVNIDKLVEEIRLPPGADDWFIRTVVSAVENSQNTKFSRKEIRTSKLDSERHF